MSSLNNDIKEKKKEKDPTKLSKEEQELIDAAVDTAKTVEMIGIESTAAVASGVIKGTSRLTRGVIEGVAATTSKLIDSTKEAVTQETSIEGAAKSASIIAKGTIEGTQKGIETVVKGAKGLVEELGNELETGREAIANHIQKAEKKRKAGKNS